MDVTVTRLFKETLQSKESIVVHRGGARSGKSYSVIQYLIYCMTNYQGSQILMTRKTMPALRLTSYKVFVELLQEYNLYNYCYHSKTNNTIIYRPTNSFVAFVSIDNPERIKSSEFNIIHMEEANEFTSNDYTILKTRLSAPTKHKNKLILSFNPVSALSWLKTDVIDKEKDCKEIVSNYKDNPFLSKEYIDILLQLKEQDVNAWRIYGEGEWGSLENVIYNNWTIVNKLDQAERTIYGLDFGFNNPTALVEVRLAENGVHVKERLYQSKMTNQDLISWIKSNLPPGSIIYGDSAEPARIEEMRREGLEVFASDKSVKDGIDFVRRQKLFVSSDSLNLIKELHSYSYKKDKDGQVTEEPVKAFDHACFVAGTKINTISGYKNIEEIKVGEKVFTSGGVKEVIDCGMTGKRNVCKYTINDIDIISTPDHPLITPTGKKKISEIEVGDTLIKIADQFLKSINIVKHFVVQNLVQQNIDGKRDVYNLTVADKHEYFANGLLVSNCDAIRYALYTHLGNRPDYTLIVGDNNV